MIEREFIFLGHVVHDSGIPWALLTREQDRQLEFVGPTILRPPSHARAEWAEKLAATTIIAAARDYIGRALTDPSLTPLDRAQLLPTSVEIALVSKDSSAARLGAEDLAAIAHEFGSTALEAATCHASGALYLAEDQVEKAVESLRARPPSPSKRNETPATGDLEGLMAAQTHKV
jgi:hypothetical protein